MHIVYTYFPQVDKICSRMYEVSKLYLVIWDAVEPTGKEHSGIFVNLISESGQGINCGSKDSSKFALVVRFIGNSGCFLEASGAGEIIEGTDDIFFFTGCILCTTSSKKIKINLK